jgi:large repetitive protein
LLTGAPDTPGSFTFTLQVSDSGSRSATRTYTVIIAGGLAITTSSLPDGEAGVSYSATVVAAGGNAPYTLASAALPSGLQINSAGAVSGTPSQSFSGAVTVTVRDGQSSASKDLALTVYPAVAIATAALPNGSLGTPYSASLSASGGSGASTWSLSGGVLPSGLALSSAGVVSGTPAMAGSSSFSVRVADATGLSAAANLSLTVGIPNLSAVSVTQLQDTIASAAQPTFGISLAQSVTVDLDGVSTLSFQPDSGLTNPDVRFPNGRMTASFRITSGSMLGAATAGDVLAFQTGTVAGTITLCITLRSVRTAVRFNRIL